MGVVLTFIDVTQRKRAVEELSHARSQLEARVDERTREIASANQALRKEAHDRDLAEQGRAVLARELASAQEEERRRISRELHDQLGQHVSAIVLKLALIREESGLPQNVDEELEQLEAVARRLDGDVDFLVWELRPTVLDDLGLGEALSDYIASWSHHFEIPVAVDLGDLGEGRLEHDVETVIYRTAQEALNNVAKHSHAKQAAVRLAREEDEVVLCVRDEGRGFDTKRAMAARAGLGLAGMRERASLVGGSLRIESKPGAGTTVWVRVPVPAKPGNPETRKPGNLTAGTGRRRSTPRIE